MCHTWDLPDPQIPGSGSGGAYGWGMSADDTTCAGDLAMTTTTTATISKIKDDTAVLIALALGNHPWGDPNNPGPGDGQKDQDQAAPDQEPAQGPACGTCVPDCGCGTCTQQVGPVTWKPEQGPATPR